MGLRSCPGAAWLAVMTLLSIVPPAQAQPAAVGEWVDPVGDTLGNDAVQLDLIRFSARSDGSTLLVELDHLGASGVPSGLVEIDADRDGTTGSLSRITFLCPAETGLGVDYTLDLFAYDAPSATVPLLDSNLAQVGAVPAQIGPETLRLRVPLALLGNHGIAHVAAILGTAEEGTDCAPDGGYLASGPAASTVEIPTLPAAGLGLLALVLALLAVRRLSAA